MAIGAVSGSYPGLMTSSIYSAYQYSQANSISDMLNSVNRLSAPNAVYNNAGNQNNMLSMESIANLNSSLTELNNALKGLPSVNSATDLKSLQNIGDLNAQALNTFNSVNSLINGINRTYTSAANAQPGQDVKNYLTTIKSASQGITSSLKTLMGNTVQNPYNKVSPASSDTSKLTIDNSGAGTGSFQSVDINIDQLASAQVNKGLALASNGGAGASGLYEFSITKDGNTHSIFVSADASDTNLTLQEKMAKAINDKNIGVIAGVEKSTTDNTAALTIQSAQTGSDAKNQFSIQDLYGDMVSRTGADSIISAAQDALYRVNGGTQQSSASNTIELNNGVKATFKEASGDTINVSVKQDVSGMMNALQSMADNYNSLVSAAKNADTPKALSMNLKLAGIINTYATSLNRVGVNMGADGLMSIDKEKATSAASGGEMRDLFTQGRLSNYGFANRLSDLASEINANPMKFTDLSSFGLSGPNNSFMYTPFQSSRYAQAYTTGLFLNMFV